MTLGVVFARHPCKREKEIVSGYEAVFGEPPPNNSQRPSGPNLTIRFAQGFSVGLGCASLRDARANDANWKGYLQLSLERISKLLVLY